MACVVDEIMSTHLVSVSMDETLDRIGQLFETFCFHHLVVTDERGKAVGIVSDRDLLKHTSPFIGKMAERPQDLSTMKKRAHQIMTRPLISMAPGTPIERAATEMLHKRISCLPIVDAEGVCVGVISWRDLLTALVYDARCRRPDAA